MEPAEPQLIAHFKTWLRKHRGASDSTIKLYTRDAARMLTALGADSTGWGPAVVRSYFMDRARTCGSGTVEKLTTSLRAFLRYLAVEGCCQAGLDTVVPAYAHWRLADMPRYLAAEQVNRLIAACDGKAIARRRDRAIILLLARLGLRAGDVAQLCLVDIEWQTARCASQASRAMKSACRFRKMSAMRSPPTSSTGLPPVRAIACSCARSLPAGRSGMATASRRW